MQTCPECGGRNEDGELFCGECGTYLEWVESPAAAGGNSVADDGALRDGGTPSDDGALADDGLVTDAAASAGTSASAPADAEGGPEAAGPALPEQGEASPPELDEPLTAPKPREVVEEAPAAAQAPVADPHPTATGGDAGRTAPTGPAAAGAAGAGLVGALGAARGAGRFAARSGRARSLLRSAADEATGGRAADAQRAMSRASAQQSRVTGRRATAGRGAATAALSRPAAPAPERAAAAPEAPAATPVAKPPTTAKPTGTTAPAAKPASPAATRPAPTQPAPAQPRKPEPRQPAARKPGTPVPRRKVRPAAEEEPPPNPGDLICGACGAGNAPHRNFCRRCGSSLADAPVQPQRSWWRRLLRPQRRPTPAGTRRRTGRRRRFPTGLLVTLLVLALAGGAVWYFREPIVGAYESVIDRAAGNNPVNPSAVTASSELEDRPAAQARDGISNRSWAPAEPGVGEWIEFDFAEPYRLVTVLVSAGNGPNDDERLLEARPQRVRLTLTTPDGEEIEDHTLADTGEPQPLAVGTSEVSAVRLTVLSVYGAELQAPVAVAEVEFRGRG